ncbi:MAG: cytidyltransferase, partial [Muribaculaceae bacterium]|nr:cytidyltransferase [Muribaculaceae bacterium]
IDIAGTWIDQPYVSRYGAGWAITASVEPTYEFMDRGGMSTSTRNSARKIWPYELPNYHEEMLARLLFCFENGPENGQDHISGAQDAIGICCSGLARHHYDGRFWPDRIESCHDEATLQWLESHLCLVEMFPRPADYCVTAGQNVTPEGVARLTEAADRCWDAIMRHDLKAFAESFGDSFAAQTAMFPAMRPPSVEPYIAEWSGRSLAHKLTGAGGGGYLLLVIDGPVPEGAIPVRIRRPAGVM